MIYNLISTFKKIPVEKQRVIKNTLSLSLLQGSNYLLPLITLPYLVRVLGPEKYGLNAFASAFIAYFVVITDYGFVHTAPRTVAINKDDSLRLSQIFNSIMIIKIALLLLCFIILISILLVFNKFKSDSTLYYVTFLSVIGNILFPVWFFQGIEDMKYMTYFNLLSRFIYTVAIFVFIKVQSDYILVPLFLGLSTIIVGIISLWIIRQKYKINFVIPPKKMVYDEFKAGRHVFLGMAAVSLNYNTNAFLLGILANNTVVGYVKAAETLIRAIASMVTPILQATYPYVSRLAIQSKLSAIQFTRKVLIVYGIVALFLSIFIFLFASRIVFLVYGPKYIDSVIVLQILSLLPFLIGVSGILATHCLLAFELNKQFSTLTLLSGAINVTLLFILTPMYHLVGISVAMLVADVFTTSAVFYYLRLRGINFFPEAKIRVA